MPDQSGRVLTPLDVSCPTCGERPGSECFRPTPGWSKRPHAARVEAAQSGRVLTPDKPLEPRCKARERWDYGSYGGTAMVGCGNALPCPIHPEKKP